MTDDRPERADGVPSAPPSASDAGRPDGALPSRRAVRAAASAGEQEPPSVVPSEPVADAGAPPELVEPPVPSAPDPGPATEPVAIEDLATQAIAVEDLTTQAVPIEELVTQAVPMGELLDPPPPANVDAPTELIADAGDLASAGPSGPSTLDTVFGDSAFVEYEDAPLLARRPDETRSGRRASPAAPAAGDAAASAALAGAVAPTRASAAGTGAGTSTGMPRSQKVLIGIAVGLGVLVAVIAAFIIGMRLPGLVGFGPVASMGPGLESSAAPSEEPGADPSAGDAGADPSVDPTAEPAPSESAAPATGPLPPGLQEWDALVGGECLDPFIDPWQEEYVVVDCAAPHAAQLVVVGTLPGEEVSAYPGEEALAGQIPALCRAAGVIDLAAGAAYRDLQVEGAYPVSAEDWAEGERRYSCFVTRSSGEPITGSLAAPLG
ncbi:septum formation family protein [Microcella daejeonensis]|uniref:septum formation family protein n=1 Tax=Microcella daejeonensis TaxID=2994971 RepID=UPI00226D4CB9|nr:septum formation family protein [Microcella daejeonensis]WAB84395.1 septum formation family protein [Microcella daejeonensis]